MQPAMGSVYQTPKRTKNSGEGTGWVGGGSGKEWKKTNHRTPQVVSSSPAIANQWCFWNTAGIYMHGVDSQWGMCWLLVHCALVLGCEPSLPEASITRRSGGGSQSHNGVFVFLSLCQIMIFSGGKEVGEPGCFCSVDTEQRTTARANQIVPHSETQQMRACAPFCIASSSLCLGNGQGFVS